MSSSLQSTQVSLREKTILTKNIQFVATGETQVEAINQTITVVSYVDWATANAAVAQGGFYALDGDDRVRVMGLVPPP